MEAETPQELVDLLKELSGVLAKAVLLGYMPETLLASFQVAISLAYENTEDKFEIYKTMHELLLSAFDYPPLNLEEK